MAGKWVRSLQCKSRAIDDVFSPLPKHQPILPSASTCRNSFQGLKDVVSVKPKYNKPKPDKPVPVSDRFFPTLSDLPEGHPSRNVVEIIFHTRWGSKSAFPGRVDLVFKVHNSVKTLTLFEEYRDAVKSRPESDVIRCVADGNEMMQFYCLGPTTSGIIDGAGSIWEIDGAGCGKSPVPFGTFSGSGAAHNSAGGGKGRRAMLVCRVIAGRVAKRGGFHPIKGFDSVSGENGELLVFDARAVLPCFLVIYKL